MKADAHFGRFGCWFLCAKCKSGLKELDDGYLEHPSVKGILTKSPIICEYAGMIVCNPFKDMELKPK